MKGITWTQIAIELARLNKTMAEILHLIQKEMKRGEELSKKYEKESAMNKLKKLGFKKVPGTEPGFHMYELTNPATLL
jgi:IS30 family transposase